MLDNILANVKLYYPMLLKNVKDYRTVGTSRVIITSEDGKETIFNDINKTFRRLPDDKNNMSELECRREFGFRLRDIMTEKSVSQMELSERTGIPCPVLSRYMRGKTSPTQYQVDRIARALDCSADDFRYL